MGVLVEMLMWVLIFSSWIVIFVSELFVLIIIMCSLVRIDVMSKCCECMIGSSKFLVKEG